MGEEIDVKEATRSQVMQTLFGDHSEDDEEGDVTSEHKAAANCSGDRSVSISIHEKNPQFY